VDARFKKCPWLFKKGNKVGVNVDRRKANRARLETMIQRLTDNGDVIVQFFCAVASGQPFTIRVVKELPMTKEQEAVAQGIATDVQKAAAKKQRRYLVTKRPYYPSMAEITEAFKWLADRGFGQAPKTVQIEGSVTTGFKMVVTRRACRWPRCPSRSWCQRGCWRRTRTASQEPTARTATRTAATARAEQSE